MADQPSFEPAKGGPDNAYRNYHGAALVGFVLRAADWWLQAKKAGATSSSEPTSLRHASQAGRAKLQRLVSAAR